MGAIEALNAHGVPLVGGHSAEGSELSLALTVTGRPGARVLGKAGLKPGDRLVLNKPIGTGILMAANMRGMANSLDVAAALSGMETSNRAALDVLLEHGVTALTDVTGFGLAGHLCEMLRAGGVGCELHAAAVPVLSGARALAEQGIVSSLHANNQRSLADFIIARGGADPLRVLLTDPQTSGGLLAGIPGPAAVACVAALRDAGFPEACLIGEVRESGWIIS